MLTYVILAFFSILSGATTVLFGFGGGFVTVPLLYALLAEAHGGTGPAGSAAMHVAVATSTAVMVVTSLLATLRHARLGNIVVTEFWPLVGYIAIGACAGATFATDVSGDLMRYAFVAYVGVTILDCLLRRGFLSPPQAGEPLRRTSAPSTAAAGIVIGAIATFLGLGGSVMTVPMMRRRGMDMTRATAMANPLAFPVALVGTGFYTLMRPGTAILSPWQVGSVDGVAFVILVTGSLLGIRAASPLIGRIQDVWHARAYVLLLVVVLLSMIV